jgi:threonine 3-dehydrogenase
MQALVFSLKDGWEQGKGFKKCEVPTPALNEPEEAEWVIVKTRFAGVCGTDRGIWFRQTFKDAILNSLEQEKKETRIIGHELFGEIVEAGKKVKEKYGLNLGDNVSAESHITCGRCFQCQNGESHVCQDEKILGISLDGVFAPYAKLPAKVLWLTNQAKIRPEIACLQEPFGNAVHACTKVNLQGKQVAIFGCGPIGLFSILICRAFGASLIIGIDKNKQNLELAHNLGADFTVEVPQKEKNNPAEGDEEVIQSVYGHTGGRGADVAFEMAGYNSSVNNAIYSVRRGGEVILFGLKSGDFIVQKFDHLIRRGLTFHAVIGRQIFKTWHITKGLLENDSNKIQEKLWTILLRGGKDTVLPFASFNPEQFEKQFLAYPKIIINF